jgi:hypothetical protein
MRAAYCQPQLVADFQPISPRCYTITHHTQYYNREHLPIGAYKGSYDATVRGSYVDDLVAHSTATIKNYTQTATALSVYRSILAAVATSNSVMIASIGFTTNLEALLQSPPDSISPLSGVQLVEQKVKGLAWMGGRYVGRVRVTGGLRVGFGVCSLGAGSELPPRAPLSHALKRVVCIFAVHGLTPALSLFMSL